MCHLSLRISLGSIGKTLFAFYRSLKSEHASYRVFSNECQTNSPYVCCYLSPVLIVCLSFSKNDTYVELKNSNPLSSSYFYYLVLYLMIHINKKKRKTFANIEYSCLFIDCLLIFSLDL